MLGRLKRPAKVGAGLLAGEFVGSRLAGFIGGMGPTGRLGDLMVPAATFVAGHVASNLVGSEVALGVKANAVVHAVSVFLGGWDFDFGGGY